jgi:hypothetical protein
LGLGLLDRPRCLPQVPDRAGVPLGLQFTEIETRTRHSEGSIRRYLADFRQVAALYARGASIPEIRAATSRSASLIGEYIALYERARREFPAAPRLQDLLDTEAQRTKKGSRR